MTKISKYGYSNQFLNKTSINNPMHKVPTS